MALRLPRAPQQRPVAASRYLLLAALASALALHAGNLPVWLLALVALLSAWWLARELRAWRAPPAVLRIAATLLMVVALYQEYGTVFGLHAGTGWLTGMTGLKFLELRRKQRDYALVFALVCLLLVAAGLYQQDLSRALLIALVFVLALWMLAAAAQPDGLGNGVALRQALVVLVLAVPLAATLYFFFPRIQGSLWGLDGQAMFGRAGLAERLRPGSLSSLAKDAAVAFRVQFDGAPPPPAQRYWRVLVLDASNGFEWFASGRPTIPEPVVFAGAPVDYRVTLEPQHRGRLPLLDLPAALPPGAVAGTAFTARDPAQAGQRYQYRARSWPRYRIAGGGLPDPQRWLALPVDTDPGVRALAARLAQEAGGSVPRFIRLTLAHFADGFRYTLNPPPMRRDPVAEFLLEHHQGYCEHFAAALVTLARAAGVPARVVVGYQGGELNPGRGYYLVRQSSAHAWTELWLAELGWWRVDPTAAVAPARIEFGSEVLGELLAAGRAPEVDAGRQLLGRRQAQWLAHAWRDARLWWDGANHGFSNWVTSYGPERQLQLLRELGMRHPDRNALVMGLATGVGVVLLVLSLALLRPANRPDPLRRHWDRFCTRLERIGLARRSWEGPLEFSERVALARPDLAEPVGEITRTYIAARYGGEDCGEAFKNRVRAFRSAPRPA
jgi:transglutaminase-like putative cysteine protease